MGGIETVRRLLARDKNARVLVLSAHEDTAHPKRVLKPVRSAISPSGARPKN